MGALALRKQVSMRPGDSNASTPTSPYKPSPLSFNSPRVSPFRRPETPLGGRGSPGSTIRASTPNTTSPTKHTPQQQQQYTPTRTGSRATAEGSPECAHSPLRSSYNNNSNNNNTAATNDLRPLPSPTRGASATPSYQSQLNTTTTATASPARPGLPRAHSARDPLAHLAPSLLHTMRESFAVLDRSSSGAATRADVADTLAQVGLDASPAALAEYFPAASSSSSSAGASVPLAAYLRSLADAVAPASASDELLAAFAAFDSDDSGSVDARELREAVLGTAPEGGARGLSEAEVDAVMEGFCGRRGFGAGGGGGRGLGGAPRGAERVFRYGEFVGAVCGTSGRSGEKEQVGA
ncbi:hypothetical protein BDY21DRAFT_376243 [Lineolata rhizophorae]|uniref:EF-hand domain-containing protein n=1 Tax=Lineolata rhizophorae TaxID=578093 RepID=A0A6A6PB87_9PEZI|nr:hypothetical protein BDY21DRAFT_376243 [Lineolata rhizophorae]